MRPLICSVWHLALFAVVLCGVVSTRTARAQQQEVSNPPSPSPADPLTTTIHIEDAERFARLFTATDGKPTADQIQRQYLDNASYGVSVFTPYRIMNAGHMAAVVTADRESYARAIRDCLPRIRQYDSDLHAIYLAMHDLIPDKPLPQIYIVFGAGNSGGTAGPEAQVLGLEVLCKISGEVPDGLRTTIRRFFAHETVHTFQNDPSEGRRSPLLTQVLIEGGADFIASIVTGETPEPQRAKWATQHEGMLWDQFQQDLLTTQASSSKKNPEAVKQARLRWIENYQVAPPDWPFEVGYWMGMRIWQCYYQAAADKHQAIHDVIDWDDPQKILEKSDYRGGPCVVEKTDPHGDQLHRSSSDKFQ